jgi:hypothetical protein
MNGDNNSQPTADPAAALAGSWAPVGFGLAAGVVAGIAWFAADADAVPARAVAAGSFGLLAALAGWLTADTLGDRRRRNRSLTGEKGEVEWAEVPPDDWAGCLRRQLRTRYAAAALAAVCGAVTTFVRLTPERVLHQDFLSLGFPALIGVAVAALGAWVTLGRESAWESLFAGRPRREEKQEPPAAKLPGPTVAVRLPEPAKPAEVVKVPEAVKVPEPVKPPEPVKVLPSPPPPAWNPTLPADGGNDER